MGICQLTWKIKLISVLHWYVGEKIYDIILTFTSGDEFIRIVYSCAKH